MDCVGSPLRFIICGGKGSGKSTLTRYLSNICISAAKRCCFLDCDIGQSELTSSGFVSLTCLTQPLFGPPCASPLLKEGVNKDQFKVYVALITPTISPRFFLKCIERCIDYYNENYTDVPLIVNWMGWVRGLGRLLLNDVVGLVKPTGVVNLIVGKHSIDMELREGFEPSGPSLRREGNGPMHENVMDICNGVGGSEGGMLFSVIDDRDWRNEGPLGSMGGMEVPPFEIHTIEAMGRESLYKLQDSHRTCLQPIENRLLTLLSYFIVNFNLSAAAGSWDGVIECLRDCRPFYLNLSRNKIRVRSVDNLYCESWIQVARVLNCSLIGLGIGERSFGIGFVRGFHIEKPQFRVNPESLLQKSGFTKKELLEAFDISNDNLNDKKEIKKMEEHVVLHIIVPGGLEGDILNNINTLTVGPASFELPAELFYGAEAPYLQTASGSIGSQAVVRKRLPRPIY